MEKAEFQLMLAAIADLFLTAHVLILLDGSYASRFWTLTEAWCAMQTVTPHGLLPATEAERRYTITCIHNATDEHDAKGLVDMLSTKTPEQMFNVLKRPDVNVTNAKDKIAMLPLIKKTNDHVIETFWKQAILPEPEPAVATAAPIPVSALEKRYPIRSRVVEQTLRDASSIEERFIPSPKESYPIRRRVVKQTVWDASSIEESEELKAVPVVLNPFAPKMMKLRTSSEQAQTGRSIFSRKGTKDMKIREIRGHALDEERWDDDAPFLYFLPAQVVRECKTLSLPPMQTLRDDGHLGKFKIPLVDAFRGNGVINHILFVSHRWEEPGQPDVEGEQLKAIKAYLEAHPDIEWVWYDYSSMPQRINGMDNRTVMEKAEFQLMLAAIADLYLTSRFLILLDGAYASRFWTLTEAWCAMQTVTPEGLRPATEAERRYTITCIHTATETTAKGLVDLVSGKTPEQMFNVLKRPDVNVTNSKDKIAMLPVLRKINDHVIETFRKFSE